MAVATESLALSLGAIKTAQEENFKNIKSKSFAPPVVTQEDYSLPPFREGPFPFFQKHFLAEEVIKRTIKRNGKVTVLDLGCGAGFWLEKQLRKYGGSFEGYGISASDYRLPEQRAPLVPTGGWIEREGRKIPTVREPHLSEKSGYVGYPRLLEAARIDDGHYLVGDVHSLLRHFPEERLDIIVSQQAFYFFLDPLRVLKQVHRILKRGGYAFLESFKVKVFDKQGKEFSPQKLKKLFQQNGDQISLGEFSPNG